MSSRRKMLRELDRLRFDDDLTVRRDLRPWFARPAILWGALTMCGFLLVLVMIFLRVA